MGPNAKDRTRFVFVAAGAVLLDLLVFHLLYLRDVSIDACHFAGFLAANAFFFAVRGRWVFRHPWRFAAVLVLALLMRGAVLGALLDLAGFATPVALALSLAAASVVTWGGVLFFVFAPADLRGSAARWTLGAAAAAAYLMLVRLLYLGQVDIIPQEGYYWLYAQHPALSYYDHPPMTAWLIGAGTAIFGNTEFGVRSGVFALWFATAGFSYGLARNLYGGEAAPRNVALVSVMPFFFGTGFFATPDGPLTACWAGSLFFLERALLAGRQRAWIGAGICLGLGLLSKYTIVLLGLPIAAFLIFDRRARASLLRPGPWVAAALALAVFTPVIVWNARNDWASFAFQGSRRLGSSAGFSLHLVLLAALFLLTPTGVVVAVRAMVARDPSTRRRLFAIAFTLLPLSVFLVYSLTHRTARLNWTGPIWLAVLPAIAARIRRASRAWTVTVVMTMIGLGGLFHYLALGLPMVPARNERLAPIGWEEASRRIMEIEHELERETGRQIVVIDVRAHYVASAVAFYDREDGVATVTGNQMVGGTGLMFGVWHPPKEFAGRDALLVAWHRKDLADRKVAAYFERLGPIEEEDIEWRDREVGRLHYRVGYGYRPPERPR